jgi:hypothetical protein
MPADARPVTGYLFCRGRNQSPAARGDNLGIGGLEAHPGKLIFSNATHKLLGGKTSVPYKAWNHVVLVREGARVRVHLNGSAAPEIDAELQATIPASVGQLFIGGRSDNEANFEGKIDEVAVYDRALAPEEIARIFHKLTR